MTVCQWDVDVKCADVVSQLVEHLQSNAGMSQAVNQDKNSRKKGVVEEGQGRVGTSPKSIGRKEKKMVFERNRETASFVSARIEVFDIEFEARGEVQSRT